MAFLSPIPNLYFSHLSKNAKGKFFPCFLTEASMKKQRTFRAWHHHTSLSASRPLWVEMGPKKLYTSSSSAQIDSKPSLVVQEYGTKKP